MEQNPLSCDHCGETFQRREHRDRHVLRHTGLKPFQCNICSKSFSRSDTLIRHRALHKCVYPEKASSARRDDGETITVRESSQGQEITASSPLTAQGADFQEEAFIPGDLHGTSEEWDNPPSIPSDTSGMPTIASSAIYTTVPETSSSWPTLPDTFTFSGDFHSHGTIYGYPWMPWTSSMAHFSFPWFMDELEVPLDLSNMSHPHEDTVHHATSTEQTVEASAYLSTENICSTYTQPCHPFPEPEAIGLQMAGAEVFGHIPEIPQHTVEGLNSFYKTQRRDSTPTTIPHDIIHAFVDLYFEYFDSQFPFLHPSRLEDPNLPWILLLAVAAVGSHYSEIPGADEYNTALCNLLARAVELPAELDNEAAWQGWITEESELRLLTCVRVLECLSHIFLGTPLVFNPREATLQLPCAERLWQSQDASEWKSRQEVSTGIVVVMGSRVHYMADHLSGQQTTPDAFVAKVILLELYIDDRNYYRQLRNSQLLKSSFASHLNSSTNSDTLHAPNPSLHRPDTSRGENALLGTTVDQLTLKNMSNTGYCTETIFHVIAILRLIPLETLHSATGWETNKEQMKKSKMHLNDLFKNNDVKARKGLWHATCIFKITRSSRRLACYDALSLTVAMGYIYCYSETRTSLPSTSTRPRITRLDQLQDREAIEQWIESGVDSVVHLTGVGILDGSDHCVRFLRDLERTLVSQIAWRGFCRAFASSFAQLRRGETPTKSSREYSNAE
ncbi:hypothetical protein FDENT_432 [Fusarium denticulatum]|uniref:C2H2-type domain-containing protein n=1 Tax=Fusarium denticulatum TaxID=48507 RepID=A0A8H5XKW6_9HYPO|nr:hypothetical protein FDENT_432 [Fusarium denticulatum]